MSCKNCGSERTFDVGGKVSDMFIGFADGHEIDGYVPSSLGVGSGDYIDIRFCADCGMIDGNFPLEKYNPDEE